MKKWFVLKQLKVAEIITGNPCFFSAYKKEHCCQTKALNRIEMKKQTDSVHTNCCKKSPEKGWGRSETMKTLFILNTCALKIKKNSSTKLPFFSMTLKNMQLERQKCRLLQPKAARTDDKYSLIYGICLLHPIFCKMLSPNLSCNINYRALHFP